MRTIRIGKKIFTVKQIVVIVCAICLLFIIMLPSFRKQLSPKNRACFRNVKFINTQVKKWHFRKRKWPSKYLEDIGRDEYQTDRREGGRAEDARSYHSRPVGR